MRELSLFSGACGGVLGTKLLGWRAIGYVEWNEYCQRLIAQRIADGMLDRAPIFTDVREFVQSGAARQYRGFADVVTAGFPCQPFSVAGKKKGKSDKRNMWPETIEIIRQVRPQYVFLENVRGLVSKPYFGTILGDLAESGYDCRWRILSCAEVGGPHRRDRVWIVAYPNGARCQEYRGASAAQAQLAALECRGADLAYADSADEQAGHEQDQPASQWGRRSGNQSKEITWWKTEPEICRVVDGMAHRVDRLTALGNGQVSLVAATAWRMLMGGEEHSMGCSE